MRGRDDSLHHGKAMSKWRNVQIKGRRLRMFLHNGLHWEALRERCVKMFKDSLILYSLFPREVNIGSHQGINTSVYFKPVILSLLFVSKVGRGEKATEVFFLMYFLSPHRDISRDGDFVDKVRVRGVPTRHAPPPQRRGAGDNLN